MPTVTPAVAAATLIAGFGVAEVTGVRAWGGLVLAVGGAWCARQWWHCSGAARALAALGVFVAAFALSHPLGHVLGAWPSVLAVSVVTAIATERIASPAAVRRGSDAQSWL